MCQATIQGLRVMLGAVQRGCQGNGRHLLDSCHNSCQMATQVVAKGQLLGAAKGSSLGQWGQVEREAAWGGQPLL